jgi:hypothetical protein
MKNNIKNILNQGMLTLAVYVGVYLLSFSNSQAGVKRKALPGENCSDTAIQVIACVPVPDHAGVEAVETDTMLSLENFEILDDLPDLDYLDQSNLVQKCFRDFNGCRQVFAQTDDLIADQSGYNGGNSFTPDHGDKALPVALPVTCRSSYLHGFQSKNPLLV